MTKLVTSKRDETGSESVNSLEPKSPKYAALAGRLRDRILAGELNAGDRLPSFTELRKQYGATPTTVERVYGLLEQEELVERRQGIGTFVKEPQRKRTGNIGFIGRPLAPTWHSPFRAHIIEGIQQAIGARQQHLLYMGSDDSLNTQACDKVDGVLLYNIEDTRPVVKRLPRGLPRVSLLNVAEGMTSIVADDYGGARLAVRHLLEMGHRRIGCLMEKLPSLARWRLDGYYDALAEAGIEAEPSWARLTDTVAARNSAGQVYLEWGRAQMSAWLREGWEETGCTAIFAQNDLAGIGIMQALQEAEIRVPQQVSVVAFDGTEVCDLTAPRLTAVALPLAQIGIKAVEVLERQIQGEKPEAQVIVLPLNLRAGGTVRFLT